MSKGILLFSLVTAALVTTVHLQESEDAPVRNEGWRHPFVQKAKLKPRMSVSFIVNGLDNFRFEFITSNCSIAMLVNFRPNHSRITITNFNGHKWGRVKSATHQFDNRSSFVAIQVTSEKFKIYIGSGSVIMNHRLVTGYYYQYQLSDITHMQLDGGGRNKVKGLAIGRINGSKLQILDDWMQIGARLIIFGKARSNFTIDLRTTNGSFALRMRFHNTYISRKSQIAGKDWGEDETNGTFALNPGTWIKVWLYVEKDGYHISVNETVFGTFFHRVDLRLVDRVRVKGLRGANTIQFITSDRENKTPFEKPTSCRKVVVNASDEDTTPFC